MPEIGDKGKCNMLSRCFPRKKNLTFSHCDEKEEVGAVFYFSTNTILPPFLQADYVLEKWNWSVVHIKNFLGQNADTSTVVYANDKNIDSWLELLRIFRPPLVDFPVKRLELGRCTVFEVVDLVPNVCLRLRRKEKHGAKSAKCKIFVCATNVSYKRCD